MEGVPCLFHLVNLVYIVAAKIVHNGQFQLPLPYHLLAQSLEETEILKLNAIPMLRLKPSEYAKP